MAPELVDVEEVGAGSGDGDFEEALALGGFEEESFFLGEAVADAAAADLGLGGETAAEFFDVVFVGAGHGGGSS